MWVRTAPQPSALAPLASGIQAVDRGLWTVDWGPWTVDCGLGTVDFPSRLSAFGLLLHQRRFAARFAKKSPFESSTPFSALGAVKK